MAERILSSDIDILIERLQETDYSELQSFSCGTEELDNFFREELPLCVKYRYFAAYCAKERNSGELVAIFTLANDVVVVGSVEDKADFVEDVKFLMDDEYVQTFERQSSFPAINIGHLGIREDWQSKGIGSQIVDFILYTFSNYRLSGCQFITVDSLNNPRTNKFYMNNGFVNQTNNDSVSHTRRMYMYLPVSGN